MNEVLVAIVGGLALVIVALISNRGRQHAKAARVQVENNHRDDEGNVINLREEADERHDANQELLRHVLQLVGGLGSDIRGMRRDIGRLADAQALTDERVLDIEKTQPRGNHRD